MAFQTVAGRKRSRSFPVRPIITSSPSSQWMDIPSFRLQPASNLLVPTTRRELTTDSASEFSIAGGDGVLSTEDIVVGALIGLFLAFTVSFLQGLRNQNDFVLWEKKEEDLVVPSTSSITDDQNVTTISDGGQEENSSLVFDGNDWREMSRPENYIFYNRNLKKSSAAGQQKEISKTEKTWVIVALLALFVPIFSIEFFFALSRQIICSGGENSVLSTSEFAQFLCSPV